MFKKNNLLINIISFVLISAFLLSHGISYYAAKKSITDNIQNTVLPLISDKIYAEINRELMAPINNTALIAQDSFLVNWVLQGEKNIEPIKEYLQRIKKSFSYSSTFFISELSTNYYTPEGILKKISTDNNHDQWYYNFTEEKVSYDLDVDTDENNQNQLTIFINHRLEDKNARFLGVVGAGIKIHDLGEKLNKYKDIYNKNIYLINSSGLIQVHSDISQVENKNISTSLGISSISKELLKNKIGNHSYFYTNNNQNHLVSSRYLPNLDWFLIIEESENLSHQTIKHTLWLNILFSIFVTIVLVAIARVMVKRHQQQLEALATTDELTGLTNRRHLINQFNYLQASAQRNNSLLSIMFADLDHFKQINDQYGHSIGDEVLKIIANLLSEQVRDIDIVSRWGGEEFAILLPQSDNDQTKIIAERIRLAISDNEAIKKVCDCDITISIGLFTSIQGDESLEKMISNADAALYKAKDSGRNCVVSYN